ncbi:protein-L-isoaspartate(D-aspartate) O-methyltransferase [Planctomicrobium sp. SH664]|uniref:protein-L-isoaspartate(D-aspartate) O-methyltransferase n=1 Tax=Planctomicrobium sp. SH664 TaxID=3448125 RepID=UPI003F5C7FF6
MEPLQQAREEMVRNQLIARGISQPRVLKAMGEVPREAFIAADYTPLAYHDRALPLTHRQTISQPFTVAFMCEALKLKPEDKVLEIGTGSGYGAAILSKLAAQVHTVERIEELAVQARQRLQELGFDNVQVHHGDGSLGWPPAAPYDAICVTAAAGPIPPDYLAQLKEGGRLVIPLGEGTGPQTMCRLTRHAQTFTREPLGTFVFVPLIGVHGKEQAEGPASGR